LLPGKDKEMKRLLRNSLLKLRVVGYRLSPILLILLVVAVSYSACQVGDFSERKMMAAYPEECVDGVTYIRSRWIRESFAPKWRIDSDGSPKLIPCWEKK
jgi:hypothetical protein